MNSICSLLQPQSYIDSPPSSYPLLLWKCGLCPAASHPPKPLLPLCHLASSLTSLETVEKSRSNFLKSRGLSLVGPKPNLWSLKCSHTPWNILMPAWSAWPCFTESLLSFLTLLSTPQTPLLPELCDPWQGQLSFSKQSWLTGTSFNLPRKCKEVDCLSQVQGDGGSISLSEFGLFSIFIPVSHLTLALYTQHQCLPKGLLGVKYSVACFWGPGY